MADTVSGAEPPAAGRGLDADERAEFEALREEVAQLRTRPERTRHRFSWRTPVATLLIVLGCILAPLSVVAVWTANQVSDTSRYVANVTPLIKDPAIQRELTDKISNTIVTQINVPGLTADAATLLNQKGLPRVATLLQSFSGTLNSAVAGFVHDRIAKIITSPRMERAWVQVNTVAHQQLVAALSGRGASAVSVSNGQVILDLAPFINVAKQDLSARGLTIVNKIPAVHPTIPLFPSKDLVRAQTAYRLINDLKFVLPILTLVLLALGVYIARGHRRALIGAGLGFAASMLLLGLVLLIARASYLSAVPNSTISGDAAAAAFDILVRFIRIALRTLLVVGLVVAAGAFLTGPSVTAVRIRSWFSFAWIRRRGEAHGVSTGPVGRWTYAHRRGLRIGAVALAALLFVFWGRPTALVVILIAFLLLIVLGLIQLIGMLRPTQPSPAPGG